ncbi:MAG: indolepyruvate oxidoreductase subunit beta [Clostridia bacterium]|nr:indolepyruvate oxidoreductase subunit beta [Clostridia bacterium]
MEQNRSILLCGVGGQGTVLASKLIAYAAMRGGLEVRTSETIGMAQRGGCVVSHVRVGHHINSPLIPRGSADLLLGFEPAEAVRCLPYLRRGGTAVVSRAPISPVTASLSGSSYNGADMLTYLAEQVENLIILDTEEIIVACGSPRVLNIALLAAAAKTDALGITPDELRAAVRERLPEKFHALNLGAIDYICRR